ncbi:MAG: type I-C CRISPR-associated protein Cas7/Csd2, partial [Limisphaerales bacterium]
MKNNIKNRYDFVYLFDCTDGNPNGDPDAANAPRLDPQTMQGLVSDVAIKRKIRNYVYLANATQNGEGKFVPAEGYDLHVQHGTVLNDNIRLACDKTGLKRREDETADKEKAKNRPPKEVHQLQSWLCQKFYDVRTFGSVLSTGPNAGQLRGPVQISFARSIDPVLSLDLSITRVCGTDEQKATEMGRKTAIAYGLYCCHGFISAHLAQQTSFSEDDLALLMRGLCGR